MEKIGISKHISLDDLDDLKTVIYNEEDADECIDSDWYYYVIDETDDSFKIVSADKIERFLVHQGTRSEYYYSEWEYKSEMQEIEI